MKNQYFGDINDYRKYGLLRILTHNGKLRATVCWMLTANDGSSDGKFTEYLSQPDRWSKFDPDLFTLLHDALLKKTRRNVQDVESSGIIPDARYFSPLLSDNNREEYLSAFDLLAKSSELIFFDPDNGFEVKSVPKGSRGSRKYLYWDEVSRFFSWGASLLVYQHFPRIEREKFLTLKVDKIFACTFAETVYAFQTAKVVFFLVLQGRHQAIFEKCEWEVRQRWEQEFMVHQFRRKT